MRNTKQKIISWFWILSILFWELIIPTSSFATENEPVTFDPNISFSATLSNGNVVTSWSKYNHSEAFSYYKVVRSQTNTNPVYPDDGYIYYGDSVNTLTYIDTSVPTGTNYYRICHIAWPKRYCSQNVIAINTSGSSGEIASINLSGTTNGRDISLGWTISGSTPTGFKIVWSKTSGPTYPTRNTDQYEYLSDQNARSYTINNFWGVPLTAGTWYVRVCKYDGTGQCLAYSNEITASIVSTCTSTSWSPEPSTVCSGLGFTQTSNCGNTRGSIGTKDCTTPPNPNTNPPKIGSCQIFPSDNPWNVDISRLPVHQNSTNYINSIWATTNLHADFGGGWAYGIPFIVTDNSTPMVPINFTAYGDESDPGPYPMPLTAPIEWGNSSDGDRHVLAVQKDSCILYELYRGFPQSSFWNADSAAKFDLKSNAVRPAGWTSADAAGLPIFPGLARYDEAAAGAMNHALRFTVQRSQKAYIYPARHYASSSTDINLPPMGLRLRLKANYDISRFTGQSRVVLETLKKYGMIVADNGSNWFITGDANPGWNDTDLNQLKTVPGSAFEAVDTSSLVPGTTAINGICGSDNGKILSATPTNLCTTGTASAITGSGPWSWVCQGQNGGNSIGCQAAILVSGCTDTTWSPDTSTVCSGQTFTQTSNCGRTRSSTGTKACTTNGAIIVDHTSTDISKIPSTYIEQTKQLFRLSYWHTSHGSQIVDGITLIKWQPGTLYYFDDTFLKDTTPSGDLGAPDRTSWADRTRTMLRTAGNDRNVVMWSWCGQVSTATEADINTYLSLMEGLERDFPNVKFVYITGHLDGSGTSGNLHIRNEQIRKYVRDHGKILFDFADIESYDPSGQYYLNRGADDGNNYDNGSKNWSREWCSANPGSPLCAQVSCAHSEPLNCNLKARAFWSLMARLAGWNGGTILNQTSGSSSQGIVQPLSFWDINNSFAKNEIQSLINRGVIKGYDDGTFQPDRSVTRAEFLKITIKWLGLTVDESITTTPFSDVKINWQIPIIAKAASLGIIDTTAKKFRPDDKITRAEAVKILLKTANIKGLDGASLFSDITENNSWAIPYINKASSLWIINSSNVNFRPNDPISRAETAKIVSKTEEFKQ